MKNFRQNVTNFLTSVNEKYEKSIFLKKILAYVIIFLILLNVLYCLLGSIFTPVSHIDVIANWMYKTKVLANEQSLNFLVNWHGEFAHPQYPILLPYLFSLIYTATQVLAGINPVIVVSLTSTLVYVVSILTCFFLLRKLDFIKANNIQALFFTYIYSMFPPLMAQAGREHAGMADIFISLCYWLSIYCLWISQSKKSVTWLLVLLVITASLIKTEGMLLLLLLLFSQLSPRMKLVQVLLASSGFLGWQLVLWYLKIPSSYSMIVPVFSSVLLKVPIMITEMIRELFFNIHNWYIFWWLFVFVFIFMRISKHNDTFPKILEKFLMLVFLGFSFFYLTSSIPIRGYVSSSFDRLLLQCMPVWYILFVYWVLEKK